MSPHNGRTGLLSQFNQRAPRPMSKGNSQSEVMQASFYGNASCDPGCGCDVCCEPTCGDPGCGCDVCEPTCGDPGCGCEVCCEPECGCDPGCGVCDPCCTDTCTGAGCSSGKGLFGKLFGNQGGNGNGYRNGRGGLGNNGRGGLGNGQICSACGDPNCPGCLGGGAFCHNVATGFCPHAGGYPEYPNFNQGPPTGQVAYPYYTTRGPRDFLRNNPPSIGPY